VSDTELLELAANAAGYKLSWNCFDLPEIEGLAPPDGGSGTVHWNPLADDGDAFRLMIALNFDVNVGTKCTCAVSKPLHDGVRVIEDHYGDTRLSTRRAIVRAAAEIGKSTK